MLKSLLKKPAARQLQPDPTDVNLARLRVYSRLGIVFAVIWFLVNRPFWRHLFVALWAMAFVTLVLPAEMMFFVRHPVLAFAVPLAAGFVAANLGRSGIGTVAAWAVLVVLAIAAYVLHGAIGIAILIYLYPVLSHRSVAAYGLAFAMVGWLGLGARILMRIIPSEFWPNKEKPKPQWMQRLGIIDIAWLLALVGGCAAMAGFI